MNEIRERDRVVSAEVTLDNYHKTADGYYERYEYTDESDEVGAIYVHRAIFDSKTGERLADEQSFSYVAGVKKIRMVALDDLAFTQARLAMCDAMLKVVEDFYNERNKTVAAPDRRDSFGVPVPYAASSKRHGDIL